MIDNFTIASEWFDIAEIDLKSAKHLQKMIPTPLEVICYHCQQAAEKYLKGLLVLNEVEIPKTHDLVLLNEMCCKTNNRLVEVKQECKRLTVYAVVTRYPYKLDLNIDNVVLAIKNAESIRELVLQNIKR